MPNFIMLLIEFSCFFTLYPKTFCSVLLQRDTREAVLNQYPISENLNHPTINNQHFGQELFSIHIRLSISSVQYNLVKIHRSFYVIEIADSTTTFK